MRHLKGHVLLALCTMFVGICAAQQPSTVTMATTISVPNLIRYSGTLKDAQGTAAPSATTGVTFAIYHQQDGGAPIWMETQNVASDASGNYSVLLGSTTTTGLPADLFSQQEQRWLGVQVEGQEEQPRVLLVSVPYAFKAHEAETLGGRSISDFVLANGANAAANGGNTSQALSSSANNSPATAAGINKGAASAGPTNFSGSTGDQIVGVTQSGTGVGVNAYAASKAVVGTATATSGTAIGVEGGSPSPGGYGVYGNVSSTTGATVGVKGNSTSTAGTGVRGTNTAISGATTGISAYVASAAGIAAVFNNAAGGKILSGQNNGVEAFSVDGSGNVNTASGSYGIGGSSVLNIGNPLEDNLFLGVGAGANTVGHAGANLFAGYQAGYSNTSGSYNTFSGVYAGYSNTTGINNTFYGTAAGNSNTTGSYNTFSGFHAGSGNTDGFNNTISGWNAVGGDGHDNTFTGFDAGYGNTTGAQNVVYGSNAGLNNGTGNSNTFIGTDAGKASSGGFDNTYVGAGAGSYNATGSSNIYIASNPNPTSESNTIRIGTQGSDGGEQNVAYMAGIYSSTTNSGSPVFVDSTGKLGTGGGGGLVTSFNGRTGAVLPAANDYNFTQISGTLQSAQLSGIYSSSVDLTSGGNAFTGGFTGTFTGNGAGLTGVLPAAGSPNYIQNGTSQQASASFNISGTGAANSFASVTTYQISGDGPVLSIGSSSDQNLFLGVGAGANNVAGSGVSNLFSGYAAGHNNTLGQHNTFSGYAAGYSNVGDGFGGGADNAFYGYEAGYSNTSGYYNTFAGYQAGYTNNTGIYNTFYGHQAGYANTGNFNAFYGQASGFNNTTGSSDVYIANAGPSSGAESNAIRIGTPGAGSGQQDVAFIAGIYGSTVDSNGIPVYVDNNGQLGTVVSSRRFKEQIADMGDSTDALMKLRPVTFLYKPEYSRGERTLQYGLIAEEVAQVYPELVAYDNDGQPYTVRYQYLTPMLLNELQKQHALVSAQQDVIQGQQEQINDLRQRLSRLESLIEKH
jgi:hypothetical protein